MQDTFGSNKPAEQKAYSQKSSIISEMQKQKQQRKDSYHKNFWFWEVEDKNPN